MASILLLAVPAWAAELSAAARQGFQDYTAATENRLAQQHTSPETYLAVLNRGAAERAEIEEAFAAALRGGNTWLPSTVFLVTAQRPR